jgi:hypothetical protein
MDCKTLLREQLVSGKHILEKAVDDLSDDEFKVRLPGDGVFATWIFGHLAVSEDWVLGLLTGSEVQLPKDFTSKFEGDRSFQQEFDFNRLPSRSEALERFDVQHRRVLEALAQEDPSTWDRPSPEIIPDVFPTLGALWGVMGTHPYWHLGQLIAIRHALGKPYLNLYG